MWCFVKKTDFEWDSKSCSVLAEMEKKKVEALDLNKTFKAKTKKTYVALLVDNVSLCAKLKAMRRRLTGVGTCGRQYPVY